eukprot:CAMPEP_0117616440 /NCGR_PEP_ID=MMETSP0784-20121206/85062_1 /TAXON_ID=39447 /ORGANISM="" /LENGTH=148 /DNA_ID=CAMNT_0005420219 /DNA_START=185 /DNA_END=631 /DNA_ORIENTATION=-
MRPRVRCLLRDVLDLRDAGWVDTKNATRVERPQRLEDVRAEMLGSKWEHVPAAEAHQSSTGAMTSPDLHSIDPSMTGEMAEWQVPMDTSFYGVVGDGVVGDGTFGSWPHMETASVFETEVGGDFSTWCQSRVGPWSTDGFGGECIQCA